MSVERVFVAGAGLMGHGIAQVHAAIGKRVTIYEPDLARANAGRDRIAGNLERSVAKGRITSEARDAVLARLVPTDSLADAADADLVIEAVFEDIDVKTGLWSALDGIAPAHALFASNTSSISIDRLAAAVLAGRRARFVGMHFFSPVPVMPLVELIRGSATSDETEAAIRALSAEEGTGTADDIDTGAKVGLNHPMGPLELADFIGLDVCLGILRVLEDGLDQPQFAPPKVLVDLVAAGHLGQKTGRGFHAYPREVRG